MRTRTVAVAAIAAFLGCSDSNKASHALAAEGFIQIKTTGWQFGCDQNDTTCTGFEAIRPSGIPGVAGVRVIGVVGCGWGPLSKGCTVRIK